VLYLQNITYVHPDRDLLFEQIDLTIKNQDKIALIGNNGVGKSTLLRIAAGILKPSGGAVVADSTPYYVPQHYGQYNDHTIAEALGVADKLRALHEILSGNVTAHNLDALADDWSIEERCNEALSVWQLSGLDLSAKMTTLSGGQKTRVLLAGISMHKPGIILLDEPTNHLDTTAREVLYEYVKHANSTLLVVSHDKTLLNILSTVAELSKDGIRLYGGNYDFYTAQKQIESNALHEDIRDREKQLRKAREAERESMERQQRLNARGKQKQQQAGIPTIAMNTLRNNAEKSTARLKDVHTEKIGGIAEKMSALRDSLPDKDKMKLALDSSALHKGKILVTTHDINFGYGDTMLWPQPLSFQLVSGDRIVIRGQNGSGKTTLVKLLLGTLDPTSGSVARAECNAIYIDQDYSLVDNSLTVYQQAQQYNEGNIEEHELKSRLTHFLFTKAYWDKPCSNLSGGEKMRLILCCLTLKTGAPDMIILDEPTNNLDIQNIDILTDAIQAYAGTLVIISHDQHFLQQLGVENSIDLVVNLP
jgi:ATPase subunit of ABC transporter with duplicated ATPase domains